MCDSQRNSFCDFIGQVDGWVKEAYVCVEETSKMDESVSLWLYFFGNIRTGSKRSYSVWFRASSKRLMLELNKVALMAQAAALREKRA